MAGVKPGIRAVDLCCGTGDIALGLAKRGAEVVGVDFSARMLDVARTRAEKWKSRMPASRFGSQKNNPPDGKNKALEFIQGDAQALPFEDDSFDVATVGYGLRNLSSWEKGLMEMRRVTKPGGRVLVLEFGKPVNGLWRSLYFGYLRLFVPLLGFLVCGQASAYAYILVSLKQYPGQVGVAEKMTELQFKQVQIVNLLGGAMSINYGEKGTPSAG
jgi:demethylmenaquinone methyltransferase/2-methoxy-6-polyprenyl-1,4-benzoquinol methylase